MSLLTVLMVAGALLHCGLTATLATTTVHSSNIEQFSGYDLKQRIAYRIGQVECLKSLLNQYRSTQYGLGGSTPW